jgi:DNA-binding MarR family transcriptional regulator
MPDDEETRPRRKPKNVLEGFLNPELFRRASAAVERAAAPVLQFPAQNTTLDEEPLGEEVIDKEEHLDDLLTTQTGIHSPNPSPTQTTTPMPAPMANRTTNQAINQLDTQSPTRLPERLPKRSVKRVGGQPNGQSVDLSTTRSDTGLPAWVTNRSLSQPVSLELHLTYNQILIYDYLAKKGDNGFSKVPVISLETQVPEPTIRKVLYKLQRYGAIHTEPHREGSLQGFVFYVNRSIKINREVLKMKKRVGQAKGQAFDQVPDYPQGQPTEYPGAYPTHSDDDSINLKNHLLDDGDLADMYPELHKSGFRPEHLQQILKAWQLKKLNFGELHDSLEKAEWDVQHNSSKMNSPCVYVLTALKNGAYSSPPGFKFKRQLQAEEAAKIAEEMRKLAEETIKNRFEHWWIAELTDEDRKKIDAELSRGNRALPASGHFRDAARLEYYRKQNFV